MIRSAVLAVTERSVTKKMITDTAAGRAVASRFVAGDTLESAVAVAQDLNAQGMSVSLEAKPTADRRASSWTRQPWMSPTKIRRAPRAKALFSADP